MLGGVSHETLLSADPGESRPLWLLTERELEPWLAGQRAAVVDWVRAHGFHAERHRVLTLPGEQGVAGAVLGLGGLDSTEDLGPWEAAGAPERLPALPWRLAMPLGPHAATQFVLGWLLGGYRMTRYRGGGRFEPLAALIAPPQADLVYASAAARASALARDLINTPANDLGPAELAEAAVALAREHGARCQVLEGADLAGFPLLRAVGAGSARAAADRSALGACGGCARHSGRQGRVLRHRRPRPEVRAGHAADEEGHGRGGLRARARRSADAARCTSADARIDTRRG